MSTHDDAQTRLPRREFLALASKSSLAMTTLGGLVSVASPAPAATLAMDLRGEWRCDTHPRSDATGTQVCIDSPHAGGRQMYLIDINRLVPPPEPA